MDRLFVRVHLELTWLLLPGLDINNLVHIGEAYHLIFFSYWLFKFTVVNEERSSFLLFDQEYWLNGVNLFKNLVLTKQGFFLTLFKFILRIRFCCDDLRLGD